MAGIDTETELRIIQQTVLPVADGSLDALEKAGVQGIVYLTGGTETAGKLVGLMGGVGRAGFLGG